MFAKLYVVFVLFVIQTHYISPTNIEQLFIESKIVPIIIDSAPKSICHATFKGNIEIETGKNYTQIFDFYQPPFLSWKDDLNSLYFIMMIGISHDFMRQNLTLDYNVWGDSDTYWLQWAVTNTPGLDIESGRKICSYRKLFSTGAPTKAPYYIIMLIYKQREIIPRHKIRYAPQILERVGVHKFLIREFDLGEPVAGNFFTLHALSSILAEDLEKNLNIDLTDSILSLPDEDELKYAPR